MPCYCISRHSEAIEWLFSQGIKVDQVLPHLDTAIIKSGDIVIGVLPISLAADICMKGGRYFALTLSLPMEVRGHELTADQMQKYSPALNEYRVIRTNCNNESSELPIL